jgi:hypothetical protein
LNHHGFHAIQLFGLQTEVLPNGKKLIDFFPISYFSSSSPQALFSPLVCHSFSFGFKPFHLIRIEENIRLEDECGAQKSL